MSVHVRSRLVRVAQLVMFDDDVRVSLSMRPVHACSYSRRGHPYQADHQCAPHQ